MSLSYKKPEEKASIFSLLISVSLFLKTTLQSVATLSEAITSIDL